MNELSLFSGAGGGLLGTKLLGFRHIGYVEKDDYCQKVIAQRIHDGIFENAPIYSDIKTFNSSGRCSLYKGITDIITAGFPCQPFSIAGHRKGEADERNLWPDTIRTIRKVVPQFVLLENVPGLLSSGYFGQVLGDLAESGYYAKWTCLGADDIGANHRRKRLWILAYAHGRKNIGRKRRNLAQEAEVREDLNPAPFTCCQDVAYTEAIHAQGFQNGQREVESGRSGWWTVEPRLGRMAHGVASRVDRLKAVGNGQVPAVVKEVWGLLTRNG